MTMQPANNPPVTAPEPALEVQPADEVTPAVPPGTRTAYLFAFAPRHEVISFVKTQGTAEERLRLPDILSQWDAAQNRVQQLQVIENGAADQVPVAEVSAEYSGVIERYTSHRWFKHSFSNLPTVVGIVDIDRIVAGQRIVYLERVEQLRAELGKEPSFDALLAMCVSPERPMDPVEHMEQQAGHVFSSRNTDFRPLGAFVKHELSIEDLDHADTGGMPVAAVVALVGFGSAPVNAFFVNGRCILNNGFHRLYALRSMGITHVPLVVQVCNNPMFDLPPVVAGVPKEYALGVPRPMLMKDYFEPGLSIPLDIKKRIRSVTVGFNINVTEVPI
jgi:hypothetical protein